MFVGQKIRELRLERDLLQRELSNQIHIAPNTLCQFENGKANPSYEVLIALADFFEVSTDYLLGREDDFGNISIQKEKPASLSEDELRLVKIYRALNTKNRIRITTYAEVRLEEQGDDAAFPFRK